MSIFNSSSASEYPALAWGGTTESEIDSEFEHTQNYGTTEQQQHISGQYPRFDLSSVPVKRYIPYFILLSFTSAKFNAERLLFYYLFLQTEFACQFQSAYEIYTVSSIISLVSYLFLFNNEKIIKKIKFFIY